MCALVPRVRSRGHTIMTLLQELRVSRGDPASEGDSTADFSTFERSIRNERRTIDRSRAEGGDWPLDRILFLPRGWIVWSPVIYSYIYRAGLSFLPVSRDRLLELVPALSSARWRDRCAPARLSIGHLPRRNLEDGKKGKRDWRERERERESLSLSFD